MPFDIDNSKSKKGPQQASLSDNLLYIYSKRTHLSPSLVFIQNVYKLYTCIIIQCSSTERLKNVLKEKK